MTILVILFIFVGIFVLGLIVIYNRLIKLRNLMQEGWSGIDVQLKRRADLIPNLVQTVKAYMGHEKTVLENVTESRAQTLQTKDIAARAAVEAKLSSALVNLFAVAENYPDLKANTNFLELQKTLADVEENIQYSRRYYNGAVRDYNTAIQSFPSNIVANSFAFKPGEFFELDVPTEREVPHVSF